MSPITRRSVTPTAAARTASTLSDTLLQSLRTGRLRPAAVAALIAVLALVITTCLSSVPQANATTRVVKLAPGQSKTMLAKRTKVEGSGKIGFKVPKLRAGAVVVATELRGHDQAAAYRTRVIVFKDGTMRVGIVRVRHGHETLLSSKTLNRKAHAGQTVYVQGKVSGSRKVVLKVRSWVKGTGVANWQLKSIDKSSSRIRTAGTTRGWVYVSKAARSTVKVKIASFTKTGLAVVPDTTITSGPANHSASTSTSATFTFTSDVPDASYKCSLNGSKWAPCTSPVRYTDLKVKSHTFKVRGTSAFGSTESSPAQRVFRVKAAATAPTAPSTPSTPTTPTTPDPTPAPTPDPTPSGPSGDVKPNGSNTGVPAGTVLTDYYGNLVITKDNTVVDKLDVHGSIVVKAKNVTIRRTLVRGTSTPAKDSALVTNYGFAGLLIEDTDIRRDVADVRVDGIKGWNYTLNRVHIKGGVDTAKVQGDNVTIKNSLLEDTDYFAHDPNQGGGSTHNDNVQIQGGKNINIIGNTIRGATGFAVLGQSTQANLPDLLVKGNWLDGGYCTVKLEWRGNFSNHSTVVDNKFGPNRTVSYCAMQSVPGVDLTESNNTYEETGKAIPILRK